MSSEGDLERTRRYIQRHGLVGVMNDTKWRRLREALAPLSLRYRRKDVRQEAAPARWDGDFWHVFGGTPATIEWLEIQTHVPVPRGALVEPRIEDRHAEVHTALRESGVPFTSEGDRVRVWGYLRPGVAPDWEGLRDDSGHGAGRE